MKPLHSLPALLLLTAACAEPPPLPARPPAPPAAPSTAPAELPRPPLRGSDEPARAPAIARLGPSPLGHRGTVYDACALGPEAFVSVGADNILRVWDAKTGASRGVFLPEKLPTGYERLSCSADGRLFASVHGRYDNRATYRIEVRDGSSGRVVQTHAVERVPVELALSPRGDRLAWLDRECRLTVLAIETGRVEVEAGERRATDFGSLTWHPDGKSVAHSCVKGWSKDFGITLHDLALSKTRSHPGPGGHRHIADLAFVEGGKKLLYGSTSLAFVDALSMKDAGEVQMPQSGRSARFRMSPAGDRLALWGRAALEIRGASGKDVLASLPVDAEARWLSDDRLALLQHHAIRLVSVQDQVAELPRVPVLRGRTDAMDLSPDGTTLAAGDALGRIVFYALSDGTTRLVFDGGGAKVEELAFARDGALLARFSPSGLAVRLAPGTFERTHAAQIPWAGPLFDAGGDLGLVHERKLVGVGRSGAQKPVGAEPGLVAAVARDGTFAAFASPKSASLRLVAIAKGKTKALGAITLPGEPTQCLFSADAKLLACQGLAKTYWAVVIDTATRSTKLRIERGQELKLLGVSSKAAILLHSAPSSSAFCARPLADPAREDCFEPPLSTYVQRFIPYQGKTALAVTGDQGTIDILALPGP